MENAILKRHALPIRVPKFSDLLIGQNRVLKLIAEGKPLNEMLDILLLMVEEQSPGLIASILLLDADGIHVRHVAGPSLPRTYSKAIDGQSIGPTAGACGTAAFRREQVIVENILILYSRDSAA